MKFFRTILLSLFLMLAAVPAMATVITVQSGVITTGWTYGGSTMTLRIYSTNTFVSSTGATVLKGGATDFYQTVSCTVASTTITCPSFTLHSTTDSTVPAAKYIVEMFDSGTPPRTRGRYIEMSVPTSFGTTVSWIQLRTFNTPSPVLPPATYYNRNEINLLLAGISGGGGGTTLAGNYSNNLATAIAAIGSTPTFLTVDANTTCSTALTVPATLFLNFTNQAKMSESGTCSINFQGQGLVDPESQSAAFGSFEPGDITFTGIVVPKRLSASLWDDSDLSLKVKNADYAVKDNTAYATTVVAYPGTFSTSDIVIHKGVSLHLTQGTYLNTIGLVSAGHRAVLIPQDNTKIYGDGRSKTFIYESSDPTGGNPQIVCVSGFQIYPYDGANANIEVSDFTVLGNSNTAIDSASSAINLGNVQHGTATRLGFQGIHNFAIYVGGFSTAGNFAKDVKITDNYVDGSATQLIGTIGGDDVLIADNHFTGVQAPLFYLTDGVANSTSTITSATGGFTQAMVNNKLSIKKFGQVEQQIYVQSVTNTNTLVLVSPMPWSASGVSIELLGASSSIIDIEPNAGTKGSDRVTIARNTFEGSASLISWNAITVQRSFSDHVRAVNIIDNNIVGNGGTFDNFVDADITGDSIRITGHGLKTGDLVQVTGGLLASSPFYGHVIRVDADHIKLAYSYAYAQAGQNLTITLGGGTYFISPLSSLANSIQLFGTEYSRVAGNKSVGPTQSCLDIEGTFQSTIQNNICEVGGGIRSYGNVSSLFIGNQAITTSTSNPIAGGSGIAETDAAFTVNTTSGSPTITLTSGGPWFAYTGADILINGVDYIITASKWPNQYTIFPNAASTLSGTTLTVRSSNTYVGNRALGLTKDSTSYSQVKSAADREVRDAAAVSVSGTYNDYQPTKYAYRYDITGTSTPILTGLHFDSYPMYVTIMDGEKHELYNAGATSVTIKNEAAGSTAAYRFHASDDVVLAQYERAEIEYNATLSRWLVYKKGTATAAASTATIGSYFFDNTKLQHANHGIFWRPTVHYGGFQWEATVKPDAGSADWTGYIVSDNQGGDHNLLWGLQCAYTTATCIVTGNVYAGPDAAVTVSAVSTVNETLTSAAHGLYTGQKVTVASTGTLPGGLSTSTNYYVWRVDANTVTLQTSFEDALWSSENASDASRRINLTTAGSGTITIIPVGLTTFGSPESIPMGHTTTLAVSWDGSDIMTWTNGVVTSVQPFAPAYTKNPGGNNYTLHIAGSDHNNYRGNIFQIRAYQNVDGAFTAAKWNQDYTPELYFRPSQSFDNGTTSVTSQFQVNYMTPATIFTDYSGGFESNLHHGVPEAVQGVGSTAGAFVGTSLSLPTFVAGDITYGTYVPTPPATPSGAIVWDSFSRANADYLNPQNKTSGAFTISSTEAGSAGVLPWTFPDGSANTGGNGILNGKAFIVNTANNVCVETSTQNVDVRVDRIPNYFGRVNLIARYKDTNDYYEVLGTDRLISVLKHEAGVVTGVSYNPTYGWTTLRITASGTTFNIYTGTATEGVFTLMGTFAGTNVAGATKACLARSAGTKLVYRYDNFLVK